MTRSQISKFVATAAAMVFAYACAAGDSDPDVGDLTGVHEPFDLAAFNELRPIPETRPIDMRIDIGFDEREKLPRDAISPIYSPRYVRVDQSTLVDEELVLGVDINGDARAMPLGLLRFREMVNDTVGGVPILATW